MNSNLVRKTFIDFFKENSHKHIKSSSLIPDNDPTLMFANSGMVQFKNVFTGLEGREYNKATTSQKCVRAGGKHNDLENVGFTTRHHTFFEMLGNFSFGDYFKEQAIYYAWNLITKEFQINPNKLLVTIYHDDKDAENFWKKIANLPDEKIIKISTSDNFWSMGETGPCGPCSEIFYDHGDKYFGGPPGSPDEDGDRFIEIWNLVFMQYEQIDSQKRIDLPKPCVDTGMGLERITALLNGSNDNYSSDLFTTIINATIDKIKKEINESNKGSYRVIADHLRASAFLIADGVLPSNEGRGYVLRRILRRGIRHAYTLGSREPIFYELFNELKNLMGDTYNELIANSETIKDTLLMEETRFRETLSNGIEILNQEIPKISNSTLDGKIAFKLYDTYGFPLDLTQDFLKLKKIKVDTDGFNQAMEAQKEEARTSWKGSGDHGTQKLWFDLAKKIKPTVFVGYDQSSNEAEISCILSDFKEKSEVSPNDINVIVLTNQSCFYAESGGQIGDRGFVKTDTGTFKVHDTKKTAQGLFLHFGEVDNGVIKINQKSTLSINEEFRQSIMKNHSATHLLHAALRNHLGKHVAQRGSLVNADKLRFDFSHNKPINQDEIDKIQKEVNLVISNSYETLIETKSQEEAIQQGAMALFGEKYGDQVRVVTLGSFQNKPYSIELCGGTHVSNTNLIKKFLITSEESVSSGVRRIEACTANRVDEYLNNQQKEQENYENKLDIKISELIDEIKTFGEMPISSLENKPIYIKKLEAQVDSLKNKSILKTSNIVEKKVVKGVNFITQVVDGLPPKELRSIFDNFKNENSNSILACITTTEDKVSIIVGVTADLKETYDARELIKASFESLGSKGGGGRADFAQAGGTKKSSINEAFSAIQDKI